MALNREARLPTAWVEPFARAHDAHVDYGWKVDDFRADFRGTHGQVPWELTVEGYLDTDYPATSSLRCSTAYDGSFVVSDGPALPVMSGTEADVVFAAVSAARSWWRGRRRGEAGAAAPPDRDAGPDREAGPDRTPAPDRTAGPGLRVNDPENVFTPELLSMLQSWPASDHARSGLHRDRFSIRLAHGSLLFTTENQWGEAVTSHQLRVFSAVLDRLAGLSP